jgi:hypothetical protein
MFQDYSLPSALADGIGIKSVLGLQPKISEKTAGGLKL